MSNELTVYDRVTDPLAYAERMGLAMTRSGMFGLANEEAGMVVAMTCLCEQITPLEFQRTYHIVQGQPSMRSDAMLAEFRNRGGDHEVLQRDADGASVKLIGPAGKVGTFSLTWEEAQKEDFVQGKDGIKDNYAYPRKRMQMLWARVISDGVRTLTPEIVAGIYTPEETEDFKSAVTATSLPPPPLVEQPEKVIAAEASDDRDSQAAIPPAALNLLHHQPEYMYVHELSGRCNDLQVARILQLFQQLKYPVDKIDAALAKRGVIKVSLLTAKQADDIIEKLDGQVAGKN